MRRMILIILVVSFAALSAQNKMYIHQSNNMVLGIPLNASFKTTANTISINAGSVSSQIPISQIDSISFAKDSDTVSVNYNGNSISVINPLAFENVSVLVKGAHVVITSTSTVKNLNYKISGTSSDGMLKIYSNTKYNLIMNNVNLVNASGSAINLQSGSKATVILKDGSTNYLADAASYPDSIMNDKGIFEDQNAAFFSKGDLSFSGSGSLTINGLGSEKHALYSKDEIVFANATLIINSAAKDGIHTKDGLKVESGTINVTSTGDAIDADNGNIKITGGSVTTNTKSAQANGINSFTTLDISNAEINITVAGDEAKGIRSGHNMTLGSGNITINTSGGVLLQTTGSGFNPSYCSAIKSDSSVTINGSNLIIKSSGKAGKGISADKDILIASGNINITTSGAGATYKNALGVTDTYHSSCLTANGNISIIGGTVTLSSSGSAGRGITADGILTIGDANNSPNITITTTGIKVLISGSGMNAEYDEAKTISCNGAITIDNGIINVSSADDGIKSNLSVTINNGTVNINKSTEGIEAPIITIKNGTVNVTASDDGLNATKGNGGEFNDGSYLYINGGTISVSTTGGDGLDSNGNIVMTAGTVIVNGPNSAPEVGMDYNGTFNISGGFLIASGPNAGNMIEATSTSSAQYTIKATTSSLLTSSTIFHLQDAAGNNLVTFKPFRNAYYLVFSSPDLKPGSAYSIYTAGSSTGTYVNGLYIGGTYSGGTLKKSFSLTSKVTSVTF